MGEPGGACLDGGKDLLDGVEIHLHDHVLLLPKIPLQCIQHLPIPNTSISQSGKIKAGKEHSVAVIHLAYPALPRSLCLIPQAAKASTNRVVQTIPDALRTHTTGAGKAKLWFRPPLTLSEPKS